MRRTNCFRFPNFASFLDLQKMGQMGNIPLLGDEFNTYFPFLMVAFSSMVAANVFNRFLDLFGGSKRFHFDDEDSADDFTSSGNIILRKGEKRCVGTVFQTRKVLAV